MPSQTKITPLRLKDESRARLDSLLDRMRNCLGMPGLSRVDVVDAALKALERDYPPATKGEISAKGERR
jgi:hypothetical protein